MHAADTAPTGTHLPARPTCRTRSRRVSRSPMLVPASRGPSSPSPSPPRSWSCWTSPSSTPRCRSSASRCAWAAATCSGWSPPTCCSPAAACCSAAASPTCCPRHRVFLTGMTIFTGASLASGFANNAAELITARATQGLGAALMTPAALSLVMTTYSGAQRTRGLALWGAVGSLGIAAGVLFGGALTTWFGWQLIFWVNVPIGVVALAVGLKVLPKDVTARAGLAQFDLPGALTVIGGLGALMYGLASTSAHGWLSAAVPGRVRRLRRAARRLRPHRDAVRPARWSRRTPGRSAPWCPARPSCSARPRCSSAPCS